LPYLERGLTPRRADRLEKHLASCPGCRELLAGLCAGHLSARKFGRLARDVDQSPPEFEKIWPGIASRLNKDEGPVRTRRNIFGHLAAPLPVRVLIALIAAEGVLILVANRIIPERADSGAVRSWSVRQISDFTPLRIAEFSAAVKSPVVTEGIVRDVYFDKQEKTLHIKLVDVLRKSEPFVICEIRRPGGIDVPSEGSRVRVYGVPRYDSQPGRGWNEVNPVIAIDVVKR
jgi:hypothetical protein